MSGLSEVASERHPFVCRDVQARTATRAASKQREYLNLARNSGESLLAVVNDILDFSKIEAGKLDLDEIEFDLRECVIDAARVIAPRAHAKGLELACDTADEIPARTVGDPMRLRQVIVNLVGNAVKFTSRGEIVVRAELVPDTAGEPTGAAGSEHGAVADYRWTIAISVRDTGVGIAPEKQAVVFQPFSQADGSTTRKFGGTGLGLTISKQLVKMMGGRIWLESVLGEGTTAAVRKASTAWAPSPASSTLWPAHMPGLDGFEFVRRVQQPLRRRHHRLRFALN